jgi:hypothetical protein
MADSLWYSQKPLAKAWIIETLADGQEKSLDTLVDGLKAQGLTRKNALKALGNEVANGTVTMSGDWSEGSFRSSAPVAPAPAAAPVSRKAGV